MNHDLIRNLREQNRVFCDEVLRVRAELTRLREERRWIPVGERLPEDEECVEAAGPWGEDIAWWDGEQWLDALGETFDELVTHWRKRTPGPEGEKPELPTG